MTSCPPEPSIFAGLSRTLLQANLTALQTALLQLSGGASVATASYAQADGSKAVTFRQTDIGQVTAMIRQIQRELGVVTRARRPARFLFR